MIDCAAVFKKLCSFHCHDCYGKICQLQCFHRMTLTTGTWVLHNKSFFVVYFKWVLTAYMATAWFEGTHFCKYLRDFCNRMLHHRNTFITDAKLRHAAISNSVYVHVCVWTSLYIKSWYDSLLKELWMGYILLWSDIYDVLRCKQLACPLHLCDLYRLWQVCPAPQLWSVKATNGKSYKFSLNLWNWIVLCFRKSLVTITNSTCDQLDKLFVTYSQEQKFTGHENDSFREFLLSTATQPPRACV